MLAWGHPGGLHVTAMDGDVISPVNCVRQPFSESEIGLYKCIVLINRLNLFWGLSWSAVPTYLCDANQLHKADIVIGCVDTRAARKRIVEACTGPQRTTAFLLDIGNNAESGQFVLGQPWNWRNRRSRERLRTGAELFPELIDVSLPEDDQPSCSAEEALRRQSPFINQALGNHALALLTRLFRYGDISHQGGFVNLRTGCVTAISADVTMRQRLQRRCRRAA
jgi:PRTRC genetic system ThiF family protein